MNTLGKTKILFMDMLSYYATRQKNKKFNELIKTIKLATMLVISI